MLYEMNFCTFASQVFMPMKKKVWAFENSDGQTRQGVESRVRFLEGKLCRLIVFFACTTHFAHWFCSFSLHFTRFSHLHSWTCSHTSLALIIVA